MRCDRGKRYACWVLRCAESRVSLFFIKSIETNYLNCFYHKQKQNIKKLSHRGHMQKRNKADAILNEDFYCKIFKTIRVCEGIAINRDRTVRCTYRQRSVSVCVTMIHTSSRLSAWTYNLFSPRPRFLSRQILRAVGIFSSLCVREKIACRIGEDQNRDAVRDRAARTITEGRKKKAVHERQQPAAGAFSAFDDARNASGGILTGALEPHYTRPKHE